MHQYEVAYQDSKTIACERRGGDGPLSLIFTHGAGGGLESPGMQDFADGFATVAPIVCFQGNMSLASRIKMFHTTVEHENFGAALGGRSMGARTAVITSLEREEHAKALVLVSYPLTAGTHGETREPERREEILLNLPDSTDVLFMIGSKDEQCDQDLLAEMRDKMKARSWLVVVEGADHSMNSRPKNGALALRAKTGSVAAEWLQDRDPNLLYCSFSWDKETGSVDCSGWVAARGE